MPQIRCVRSLDNKKKQDSDAAQFAYYVISRTFFSKQGFQLCCNVRREINNFSFFFFMFFAKNGILHRLDAKNRNKEMACW